MSFDVMQAATDLMEDLPEFSGLVAAVKDAIVAEKAATTFVQRQKVSEPVQEAAAALADAIAAQIKALFPETTAPAPTPVPPAAAPKPAAPPATGPGGPGGTVLK